MNVKKLDNDSSEKDTITTTVQMASTEWVLLVTSLTAFIVNIIIVVVIFCGKNQIITNNENESDVSTN